METLGHILKAARDKTNLTVAQVSEKTKIRPHLIEAFEKDNFEILPGVYAKSFIKTYAEFLNISAALTEEHIEIIFKKSTKDPVYENPAMNEVRQPLTLEKPISKTNSFKKYLSDNNSTALVNYIIYILLILLLVLLVYFTFFDSDTTPSTPDPADIRSDSTEVVRDTVEIKNDSNEKGGFLSSFYSEQDSVILEVSVKEKAWVKIDIDGDDPQSLIMLPGSEKRWAAEEYFIFTTGNAGGVSIKRNGVALPPLGARGMIVRNVKITKTELLNVPKYDSTARKVYHKKKKPKKRPRVLNLAPIENSTDLDLKKKN